MLGGRHNPAAVQVNDFHFLDTHKVRTVLKDGEPWFVAADVSKVLGIQNVTDAMMRAEVDESEKTSLKLGNSRGRGVILINESGLYSLVMNSRKPEAKPFRKWVTGVVLPTLRKTGAYVMGEENITRPDLKAEHEADKKEITARTAMRLDGITDTNLFIE